MKASELRIGNLISFKGMWNGEVSEITAGTIGIKGNEGIFPHDGFRPIPLTEEWLVKFGFTDGVWTDGEQEIHAYINQNEVGLMGADACTAGHTFWVKCKYVHQLQNLYYALTGEELCLTK